MLESLEITIESFFDKYFEKKFYLEKSAMSKSYLLGIDQIQQFLNNRFISYPFIRVFNQSKEVNYQSFCKKTKVAHQYLDNLIDPPSLYNQLLKGSTLIIQEAHTIFEEISKGADTLGGIFQCPIQANIYITPPNSQGFNVHWDNHDVIVHQLYGEKLWELFEPENYLPSSPDYFKDLQQPPKAIIKPFAIESSDILYIPRGMPHKATSSKTLSIHVTYGIKLITNKDKLIKSIAFNNLDWLKRSENNSPYTKKQLEGLISEIEKLDFKHEPNAYNFNKNFLINAFNIWNSELLDVSNYFYSAKFDIEKESTIFSIQFRNIELKFPIILYDFIFEIKTSKKFRIKELNSQIDDTILRKVLVKLLYHGIIISNV